MVSHSRERVDNICLNCNTRVNGRYCHVCGQENIEPRETFWSLVTHFFNDFTHFDGKFFTTLAHLIKKPGYLPAEYIKGRRARYLHPIRMYLFTSAAFFLVFYSYHSKPDFDVDTRYTNTSGQAEQSTIDSVALDLFEKNYSSVSAYDSAQRQLPQAERDRWLTRKLTSRVITMNQKYKGRMQDLANDLLQGFIHTLPSLLFLSLPLLALFLKLLYRKGKFLYADHILYLVFLYIFSFILLLPYILFDSMSDLLNAGWMRYLSYLLIFYGMLYNLLSMKTFYSEGFAKTTVKFLVFNIFSFILIVILFALFFIFTFFRV